MTPSSLSFPLSGPQERERLEERLTPKILELARQRGYEGIIAAEVIAEAIATWGVFTGQEWQRNPRAYSFVGPLLKGMARRGELSPKLVQGYHVSRKSTRGKSHGNRGLIYTAPEFAVEVRGVA
jgi:hypothetical protein